MQVRTKLRTILIALRGSSVPTETHTDIDPQRYLLTTVRQSQAAVIDTLRAWTAITEQLTRTLRFPVPEVDLAAAVDRVFDVAEQTLAVQHQLARTLAGVATRQADAAVETVDTAVAAVETTVGERVRRAEDLVETAEAEQEQRARELPQPQAPTGDTPKAASPKQDRKFDGRTYEERSVEELRERAAVLEIEGRSSMSKDELIAALRNHRRRRAARNDTPRSQPPRQERAPDRRSYEERSIEELRERARELEIEGRSTMSKDELVAALRQHAK
jgi:Rho termination factor, N-terminal domain